MTEELTLADLPVTGAIPPDLDGRYLRIGPNPVAADPASYHWFTGDGMVHGLRIRDGRALWYRNRWIRSQPVAAALGEAPAPGIRNGGFDTVNTNVVEIAGRAFALVEAGSSPVELSAELDGQTYNPFGGGLKGAFTAHPHLDPHTGEQHAICYEATRPDEIRHVVVDRTGAVLREEPIAVRHGPSIHDCALTERFVVILDLPVTFSMGAMLSGHVFPYRWNPEHQPGSACCPAPGRRRTSSGATWRPATCFTSPTPTTCPTGAWSWTSAPSRPCSRGRPRGRTARRAASSGGRPTLPAAPWSGARLTRVRRSSRVPTSAVSGDRTATPTPWRCPTRPESSSWATHAFSNTTWRRAGARRTSSGRTPGRASSSSRPVRWTAARTRGWLMGLVIDTAAQTTDLVILDAQAFEGPPVACVHLAHRVPPGFHGNWLPAAAASAELPSC